MSDGRLTGMCDQAPVSWRGIISATTAGPYGGKVAVVLPHGRVPRVFRPIRLPASVVRARIEPPS